MTRMPSACAAADLEWDPAAMARIGDRVGRRDADAKTGATSAQVGAALRDKGRVLSDEPVAIAATAVATAATATNAKTGFDRLTQQS